MTNAKLKKRLAQIERERIQAASQQAEHHVRMLEQFQADLGLPLPDDVPAEVMREAERRIIAVQAAIRLNRDDHRPLDEFRTWVLSIHKQYGASR
tara:strand:+ start:279 stop:563 length:285 start_codon:yes stop_codon:yes gene_type:complete